MTESNPSRSSDAEDVLRFWFEEITPDQWWRSAALDDVIRDRFLSLYEQVRSETPQGWLTSARGCLAAIIVLDQFPRNLFRNDERSFATDGRALKIAEDAVRKGYDQGLNNNEKTFLYIPFQHSEDLDVQKRSVELYASLGDENTLKFAQQHLDIIERFGRFPHRNAILGRDTTEEEQAFLDQGALFW